MSTDNKSHERRALILSAFGALVMAVLGFSFALLTHSEALMLDGLFSLLGFVMTLGAIRISRLVYEPGNMQFQFGFAGFEPLFNLVKGLAIIGAVVVIPLAGKPEHLVLAAWFFIAGVVIYTGSLILLALTGIAFFKQIAPLGGLGFFCLRHAADVILDKRTVNFSGR